MTAMGNSIESLNSKLDPTEERIDSLDIGYLKRMKMDEESQWDVWDAIKRANICIMEI